MEYKKFVTLSYDDGVEQDKKIIEILKRYGIPCTFNLNSGLMGQRGYIGRLGPYGIKFFPGEDADTGKWKCVKSFRIPEDEIRQVYEGYEIASHSRTHPNLKKAEPDVVRDEIGADIAALSEIAGKKVVGFAYPSGATSDTAVRVLKKNHILYARKVWMNRGKKDKNAFCFPKKPLEWTPTCWHGAGNLFPLLRRFVEEEPVDDMLFSIWGHGYEFDFGIPRNNWDHFERLCEFLAKQKGIVLCTNQEAFRHRKKNRGSLHG